MAENRVSDRLHSYLSAYSGSEEPLLRLLPAKYRAVIHLFYYEGYSAQEIGAMLRRKPATVRSQLARGRDILRRQLED